MEIYNLYAKPFITDKYKKAFINVPIERIRYYPESGVCQVTVVAAGKDGKSTRYVCNVPGPLIKVAVSHMSVNRRVSFLTDVNHVMGHVFFGEESVQEVARQITTGFRPKHWNDKEHADWNIWKDKLRDMRESGYDDSSNMYGHAPCLVSSRPVKPGFQK